MSELGGPGAMSMNGADDSDPEGEALASRDLPASNETVTFLAAPSPTTPLADTVIYRPGAFVAVALILPPVAGALILAALTWRMGNLPVWLPLLPLLWIPVMLVGRALLRSVRLTRETIAFGRPLGAWSVISLEDIERLERRGPRLTLTTAAGRRVSFTPALLERGERLRRRLLLSLPAQALAGEIHMEAQRLLNGDALAMSDQETVTLTARPPLWMPALAALAAAGGLVAGVVIAAASSAPWLAVAPGALALVGLAALIWLAQEVFLSDRGVIARFSLVRVTRAVAWDEVVSIERAPGEVALILRGPVALICAGPGLLGERDARRMRELVSRYAFAG